MFLAWPGSGGITICLTQDSRPGPPWPTLPFPNCNVSGEAGGSSAQTRTIDPSVGPRCGTNPLFIGDRHRSILKFFGPLRVGLEITFDMFMFGDLELTCAGSVAPSFWLALYFQWHHVSLGEHTQLPAICKHSRHPLPNRKMKILQKLV